MNLANKFLILGLLLYLIAGVMALNDMNYDLIVLIASIVFLALGFFMHVKQKWLKIFRKKP